MLIHIVFFLMIRRPPRSTQSRSSAASDVYKRQAHTIFYRTYSGNESNPIYLFNFAKTKISISRKMRYRPHPQWTTIKRLENEAIDLLRRAINVSEDKTELGWCWYNLGHLYRWGKYPKSVIEEAYKSALDYCPQETRFQESYQKAKDR